MGIFPEVRSEMRSRGRRISLILFGLQIISPTAVLILSQIGVFHFRAAAIGNRLFGFFAFAWIVLNMSYLIYHPFLSRGSLLAGIYLIFLGFLGVFHGNTLDNIVADGMLLGLVWGFAIVGRKVVREESHTLLEELLEEVVRWYSVFCVAYLLLVTLPALYILRLPQVLPDVSFLMAVFVSWLVAGAKWKGVLGGGGVVTLFLGSGYKATIVQAMFDFFVGWHRAFKLHWKRWLENVVIVVGALVGVGLIISLRGPGGLLSNRVLLNKSRAFAYSMINLLQNPRQVWEEPFGYLDLSTAERVYELKQVLKSVGASPFTVFFGQGLGGVVDLSDSKDPAVRQSHSDLRHVRVVHLGVGWVLLKGGVIGLMIYLWWLWKVVWRTFLASLGRKPWWWLAANLALLNYAIGSFLVFARWVKEPMLGFLIGVLDGVLRGQSVIPRQSHRVDPR